MLQYIPHFINSFILSLYCSLYSLKFSVDFIYWWDLPSFQDIYRSSILCIEPLMIRFLTLRILYYFTASIEKLSEILLHVSQKISTSVNHYRQVTRAKSKSGAVVKHQRVFVVLKTTSNAKQLFKSGAAPLYRSLVTSLHYNPKLLDTSLWM